MFFLLSARISPAQLLQYNIDSTTLELKDNFGNTFLSLNLEKEEMVEARELKEKVKYKFAAFHFKHKTKAKWSSNGLMPELQWFGDTLLLSGVLMKDKNTATPYELYFWLEDETHLRYFLQTPQKTFDQLILRIQSNAAENFTGGGEQFSYLSFKGEKVPIFSEEQGLGRGDAPQSFFMSLAGVKGHHFSTYCAIPFMMSTHNRAFFLENSDLIEFDFRKKDQIGIEVYQAYLSGHCWTGNNAQSLIQKYTALTGRMPALPDWAYGTWLGLQGGSERVDSIVSEAIAYENPLTGVWIQDWVGKRETKFGSRLWWNWEADEETYPNIKEFISKMNEKGVHVLGYINPFLAIEGSQGKFAAEKGYVIKNQDDEPMPVPMGGFDAYILDLTHPGAREWYKGLIQNMIELGFSGWMADFSEWLPPDAVLFSGEDPLVYHNTYTTDWVKLNEEAVAEANTDREVIYFNRAGYSEVNRYARLMWTGDQLHSYKKNDGLASAITALLTSGLSGIAFNHSDIGGYTSISVPILRSIRSKDLFKRWAEVNAFMPVLRTHEGLKPEKNHQFYSDSTTQAFFARLGRIHYALKDYFKIYAKEAEETGMPVIRPVSFVDDFAVPNKKQDYRFLVGDDLLVIPVLKRRKKKLKVNLPEGEWIHVWSDKVYKGGERYKIEVPYGEPAVFIKKGGAYADFLKESLEDFSVRN